MTDQDAKAVGVLENDDMFAPYRCDSNGDNHDEVAASIGAMASTLRDALVGQGGGE